MLVMNELRRQESRHLIRSGHKVEHFLEIAGPLLRKESTRRLMSYPSPVQRGRISPHGKCVASGNAGIGAPGRASFAFYEQTFRQRSFLA